MLFQVGAGGVVSTWKSLAGKGLSQKAAGAVDKAAESLEASKAEVQRLESLVAEAPWSVAEWAVALRFDNPRATVLVLVLG